MLLTIDIGNTTVAVGGFLGPELRFVRRLPSDRNMDAAACAARMRTLLAEEGAAPQDVEGAVLSSVVPSLTQVAVQAAEALTRRPVRVLGRDLDPGQECVRGLKNRILLEKSARLRDAARFGREVEEANFESQSRSLEPVARESSGEIFGDGFQVLFKALSAHVFRERLFAADALRSRSGVTSRSSMPRANL